MKRSTMGLGVLLLFLIVFFAVISFQNPRSYKNDSNQVTGSQEIRWNTDLETALKEAKTTNKSIFVDFYADWCGYCGDLDDETFPSPLVKNKLIQNYVLLKVDVDENPELASKYQAYSLPTMVVLDSNGQEIKRIIGFQTAEQLANQI